MTQDPEIEAHRASQKGVPGKYFLAPLSLAWKDQTCKSKNMCIGQHMRELHWASAIRSRVHF